MLACDTSKQMLVGCSMDDSRKLVIACATVIEEMRPLLPVGVAHQVLDFGLHTHPNRLRQALQHVIDEASGQVDVVILGYGLCSHGVIGLRATGCTLVVPRVDDCITIFLGSGAVRQEQCRDQPGTYYLTKGWIEAGDGPFFEYEHLATRYGPERAEEAIGLMLEKYTRLALINTGEYDIERYRDYAQRTAARFGLRYEEIEGSTALLRKMIAGPWDGDFVLVPPGEVIEYDRFYP